MRKHITYYYKSFDDSNCSELEKKQLAYFNDYGYNFESTKRMNISMDSLCKRSGPNCLNRQIKREKGSK